jgi:hypothetical protein
MTRGTTMAINSSKHRIGLDRSEPMLLPQRVSTIHSILPGGQDITLVCTTKEGGVFYCKDDKPNRHIRATEMLITRLAGHVNIATPYCSVVEREDGSTLFGSLGNESTADELQVRDFLSRPETNEFGGPSPWLGRKLAALYVFDLFWGNPDRSLRNFILEHDTRRLCAYDFAEVRLADLSHHRFPVENGNTIFVGRFLRHVHGFEPAYAFEMIDRLDAIPVEAIQTILSEMPNEWLPTDQREGLCEVWIKQRSMRLSFLKAGLTDGSLL